MCKGLNRNCVSLQQCFVEAKFTWKHTFSLYYRMVAWWGSDTAGGMPLDSPSCRTSPALHPPHSKSSSIHECVCPPIATSAFWASTWHFWPSPLSPTPQHSRKHNQSKTCMKQWLGFQDGSRNICLIIRGRRPYRRLHSEESRTVVWAAVTSGSPVAYTVQVVVECQLCTCKNISQHTGHSAYSRARKISGQDNTLLLV